MTQTAISHAKELFPGSDAVRKFTYKFADTGDSCALLSRAHHQLSQAAALSWGKCALLPILCADFAALRENCVPWYAAAQRRLQS